MASVGVILGDLCNPTVRGVAVQCGDVHSTSMDACLCVTGESPGRSTPTGCSL